MSDDRVLSLIELPRQAPHRGAIGLFRTLAAGIGLGFFGLNASGAGCYPESAFLCATDEDCIGMGAEGICEPNAFCTYPDTNCPTGRRWHDRATDSLAGNCVDTGTVVTTATDTDSTTATDTDDPTLDPSTSTTSTTTTGSSTSSSTTDVDPGSSTGSDPMTSTSSATGDASSGTAGTGAGMCDATYGGATDYMLCEETTESCSFSVTVAMMASCDDVCGMFGGTCTSAELNEADLCTSTGAATCDQADLGDLICVCTNI